MLKPEALDGTGEIKKIENNAKNAANLEGFIEKFPP